MDGRPTFPKRKVDRTPLIGRLTIHRAPKGQRHANHVTPRIFGRLNLLHLPFHELPVEDPGTSDQRSPLRFLV
jgi:hypothetical protein